MTSADVTMNPDERKAIVDGLLAHLDHFYVFPDVAVQIEKYIRGRQGDSAYNRISAPTELCEVLTHEMQDVSHDQHLRLFYSAEAIPPQTNDWDTPAWHVEYVQRMALYNHGFFKVERLAGNIGYIDIRSFLDPGFASETAIAAMNFISNTSALIVDLRHNDGGAPAMIALLSSYLFDHQVHLITFYHRPDESTHQSWTLPYVPGTRYLEKPVYVLTSPETISGGEEFAYNLKHHQRATIVGQVTAGAAHPGERFQITPHVAVFIPTGRAISPITGLDWEGVGVLPDIEVSHQDAFDVAYVEALKAVLKSIVDPVTAPFRQLRDEIQHVLDDRQACGDNDTPQ